MAGTDPYTVSAEFLELLSRQAWRDLAPALKECLLTQPLRTAGFTHITVQRRDRGLTQLAAARRRG